jgi:hypothetical protein
MGMRWFPTRGNSALSNNKIVGRFLPASQSANADSKNLQIAVFENFFPNLYESLGEDDEPIEIRGN